MRTTAYLYLRCSTSKQDTSVKDQRSACMRFAEQNGISILGEFSDDGISAFKHGREGRKGFDALLKACDSGKATHVLVWSIDRFSRQYRMGMVEMLLLEEKGIHIIDTVSGEYSSDSLESALKQVLGSFGSQEYSKKLSHSITRGIKEKRKEGFKHGKPPLGYRIVRVTGGCIMVEDESTSNAVKQMFQMYYDGNTITTIVKQLNQSGYVSRQGKKLTHSHILSVLTNPAYGGYISGSNITELIPAKITPFIDQKIWNTVYSALKRETKEKGPTRRKNPLTGIAKCNLCGANLTTNFEREHRCIYKCFNYAHQFTCVAFYKVEARNLEQAIIDNWNAQIQDLGIENFARKVVNWTYRERLDVEAKLNILRNELTKLDKQEEALLDLVTHNYATDKLAKRLETIEKRRAEIYAEILSLTGGMELPSMEEERQHIHSELSNVSDIRKITKFIDSLKLVVDHTVELCWLGESFTMVIDNATKFRRIKSTMEVKEKQSLNKKKSG